MAGSYTPDGVCEGSHRSAVHTTRWAALDNPATPAAAVVRFARDPASPLRRVVAARVDLPQEVYAELAGDPDPRVRIALAGNPGVGEALLGAFAADADPEVHTALAHHPRLPLPLLAALAPALRTPVEPLPRIAAASEAEVRELAASTEPGVRVLVAQRRDLPVGVREALAADPDVKVVKTVASHPGLGEELLRDLVARHGVPVLAHVAANPDVAPTLLEDLALWDPPVRGVLRTVATHPRATARALIACLGDAKARRRAVAHPSFPAEELPGLLRHPDWQVAEAAASHPALPPSLMRELLGELMHESMHESTGELLGERPAAPRDDPPTGG
ncbi:hypothetical protein ACIRP0_14025 [Streptomyces sp. NPDC101733]|uniref:hypothetical protein n=1 Tax=unclassified Streptomyces TaxID=2593676 RepID=UPI00382554C2